MWVSALGRTHTVHQRLHQQRLGGDWGGEQVGGVDQCPDQCQPTTDASTPADPPWALSAIAPDPDTGTLPVSQLVTHPGAAAASWRYLCRHCAQKLCPITVSTNCCTASTGHHRGAGQQRGLMLQAEGTGRTRQHAYTSASITIVHTPWSIYHARPVTTHPGAAAAPWRHRWRRRRRPPCARAGRTCAPGGV